MKQCIICDKNNFTPIYNNILLRCDNCNYVLANLNFESLNLSDVYNENYFNGHEYDNYKNDKDCLSKNFSKRIERVKNKVEIKNIKHTLEIGCAYGFFGEIIQKEIPNSSYKGLDVAEEAIEWGKSTLNLDLNNMDYLDWIKSNNLTDIFLWDVIEHLKYPEKFIKKIYDDLEEKGRVYITTGDIGAILPRIQKRKWRMIHPPSHLHYFSKKSLSTLLKKNGFKIIDVYYPSIWRSLKQIYFSLFILNKKERKFHTWFHHKIPTRLYVPINTFDIIMITAEKI